MVVKKLQIIIILKEIFQLINQEIHLFLLKFMLIQLKIIALMIVLDIIIILFILKIILIDNLIQDN